MTKKKPEVPEEEIGSGDSQNESLEVKEPETPDYPECIGCGSTKLYWVRSSESRDPGSGKLILKRLGCRICGDKWDVAA